jgi:hypothetical protein
MTSARISLNYQSNSNSYSHYNMVAQDISQALRLIGFRDTRMSSISSFVPSLHQYRSSKNKNSWHDDHT